MKKIFGSLVAILLLLSLVAEGSITIETNKKTYNQGEVVQFTMYNNNPSPVEMDFKPSVLNNTGNCVWGCIWIAVYDPIKIPSGGNYSWTWDQKGQNGEVGPGFYNGKLNIYNSSKFEIIETGTILAYYRELGLDPNIVETNDLLKAVDDWRNDIAPPGFSVPITSGQLLTLADEWRNS